MPAANNFHLMRLFLAYTVIFSHSPQLIDGNAEREILFRISGITTSGALAVDVFFLISGYLVMGSFLHSRSSHEYLWKRCLRIYPGFTVAYWISLAMAALLGEIDISEFSAGRFAKVILRSLILAPPYVAGAFESFPIAQINGSMWTIAYEFRCYVFLIILHAAGATRTKRTFLLVTLSFMLALTINNHLPTAHSLELIIGKTHDTIRTTTLFCVGASFYFYRQEIVFSPIAVSLFAGMCILLMFFPSLIDVAMATVGAYVVFWFALQANSRSLAALRPTADISYGVYLYGWPIQMTLLYNIPSLDPLSLSALSLASASAIGYVSWKLVEEPFLRLKSRGYVRLA